MTLLKNIIKKCILRVVDLASQYKREVIYKKFNFSKTIVFDNVSFEGNIQIGDFTYINGGGRIDSGPNSKVVIGRHCAIGRYVHITSKTHGLERPTTDDTYSNILHTEADTFIGDEVWIGDGVFIGKGVRVGNNAIIGAHSVVLKDVAPFGIVVGSPAIHIRFNTVHYKYPGSNSG
jgi:acetyltransferase-like isoleucine patch superfamily enzyme